MIQISIRNLIELYIGLAAGMLLYQQYSPTLTLSECKAAIYFMGIFTTIIIYKYRR